MTRPASTKPGPIETAESAVRLPKLPEPRRIQSHGYKTVAGYTTSQVEAIRRETVQACIAVCEATEAGDGSHDYNAGCATMNERVAAALRALLEEPKE